MTVVLPRTRALVLDSWQVLYVVTPKAMCTSLLWTVAELQDEPFQDLARTRVPEVTRALAVHDQALWQRTPLLHKLPRDQITHLTQSKDWFRFCLTRHPVDRLWSAWQSKLLLREPAYVARFGSAGWFPRIASDVRTVAEDFESFVEALGDPDLLCGDQHWAPQEHLLRPRDFPYSHIGRVEDAAATCALLVGHLRARGRDTALQVGQRNAGVLPRAAVLRDPALLRRIEDLYAGDMAAFGYAPARTGRRAPLEVAQANLRAVVELTERHERIGDLTRMLPPAAPAAGRTSPPRTRSRPRSVSRSGPSISMVHLPGQEAWALPRLQVPAAVEIVVVPPSTGPWRLAPAATRQWRVLPPPRSLGVAARLHEGVRAARGDVVVLCRDVVGLSPGWVDEVREVFAGDGAGLAGAVLQPVADPQLRLAGLEFADELLNCRWRLGPREGEVPLLSSAFLAVRRDLLAELGGLDTGMRGTGWHDVDLSVRAWRSGRSCVLLPRVLATWRPAPTPEPARDFVHDLLRFAAVHLSRSRFAELVAALRTDAADLPLALAALLASDVGARREHFQRLAVRDIDALLPARAGLAASTDVAS